MICLLERVIFITDHVHSLLGVSSFDTLYIPNRGRVRVSVGDDMASVMSGCTAYGFNQDRANDYGSVVMNTCSNGTATLHTDFDSGQSQLNKLDAKALVFLRVGVAAIPP